MKTNNVGKTIIKDLFKNGLYHLFMVIWWMVYGIVLPTSFTTYLLTTGSTGPPAKILKMCVACFASTTVDRPFFSCNPIRKCVQWSYCLKSLTPEMPEIVCFAICLPM